VVSVAARCQRWQAEAAPIGVGQLRHYFVFNGVAIELLSVTCQNWRIFDHVLHVPKLLESSFD
jgi:hypothetical protein